MKPYFIFLTTSILGVGFATSGSLAQGVSFLQASTHQKLIEDGRASFVRNCSGCHGINADGAGPAASMLLPRPRNLVTGSFKFRSTPTGFLPTTEDLIRTINNGVLGASMPGFKDLAEQEKLGLALYIKSLRPDWAASEGRSITIPLPPEEIFKSKVTLLTSAYRGEKLFKEACLSCHGDNGLGDGASAVGLTDGEGQPIKPANLTKAFIKGGRSASDVFRTISTGLDGSPMPAFLDAYTEAQRWDLVAYVFYLRGKGQGIYGPKDLLLEKAPTTSSSSKKSQTTGGDSWN